MFFVASRLLMAALASFGVWWLAPDAVPTVLGCAALFGALSFVWMRYRLEESPRPGVLGLLAAADAACLALALGSLGLLSDVGFLVLASCAYAVAGFGTQPLAMASLCAATLFGAWLTFELGAEPPWQFYAQALGVFGIGLLLQHRRIVVTVTRPVNEEEIRPVEGPEPAAYMELRESFRRLREMYRGLEARSRSARYSAELLEWRSGEGDRHFKGLAKRLRELCGADALTLFTIADLDGRMAVRAFDGEVPDALQGAQVLADPKQTAKELRNASERALSALLDEERRPLMSNVPLRLGHRTIGLMSLTVSSAAALPSVVEIAEEMAPAAAAAIAEGLERQALRSRALRAELLHDVARVVHGSDTPNNLCARVVRELAEILDAEHLGVAWIDVQDLLLAATHGPPIRFFDCLSFGQGPGLQGWTAAGCPELAMFDVAQDQRFLPEEATKRRIRSIVLVPFGDGLTPQGFVYAASPRAGALGVFSLETLRLVSAELGNAIARLRAGGDREGGWIAPTEFQRRALAASSGWIVVLEPLRKKSLMEHFGQAVFEASLRRFVKRLLPRLPLGSWVTIRPEQDVLCLLPECPAPVASSWANEAAATASMVSVPTGTDGARAILAIRAKVASLGSAPDKDQEPLEARQTA